LVKYNISTDKMNAASQRAVRLPVTEAFMKRVGVDSMCAEREAPMVFTG
jgi:hypothetical protein